MSEHVIEPGQVCDLRTTGELERGAPPRLWLVVGHHWEEATVLCRLVDGQCHHDMPARLFTADRLQPSVKPKRRRR